MSYDPNPPRPLASPAGQPYGAPRYGASAHGAPQHSMPQRNGMPQPYGAAYPQDATNSPYAPPGEPLPVPTQSAAAGELMARMSELESTVMRHWACAVAVPFALLGSMAWFLGAIVLAVTTPWTGRDIGIGIAFLQPIFCVVALLFSVRLIASRSNGLHQAALVLLAQCALSGLGLMWGMLAPAEAWAYAFGFGLFFLFVTAVAAWVGGMARGVLLERRIPLYISLDDCGVWLATYSANDPQRVIWAQSDGISPPNPYR